MTRTILVGLMLAAVPAAAQESRLTPQVTEHPAVRSALAYVDQHFERQVDEWIRITGIPAPSGHEEVRAAWVRAELEALGHTVTVDSIGNVILHIPGTGGGPTLVFAAHIDTVHPLETDVTVRRRDGRLYAPGVFDNSASVANMLQAARAIRHAGLTFRGDIILIGTAQEEVGLKGMYYWLERNPGVTDMLIALDGGLGPVMYGALGIYWSRMVFSGEGSHTNTSRGRPHPARAAARCILDIYDIPLPPPDSPDPAVYNVGMMRGGHVVNAIPEEISFTVDLRTVDPVLLQSLDSAIVSACERAAALEGVRFERQFIQRSEAGGTTAQLSERRQHPLVVTAINVLKHLGWQFRGGREAVATGSTDANAGVVMGIPSIAIGRSVGGDQHTLREWSDIETAKIGTKQIILLAAALAGVAN